MAADTLHLGNITVKNQGFGLVLSSSSDFLDISCDGLFVSPPLFSFLWMRRWAAFRSRFGTHAVLSAACACHGRCIAGAGFPASIISEAMSGCFDPAQRQPAALGGLIGMPGMLA